MTNTADLLEQIPDLGEDVKDPEDCFTEGTALGGRGPSSALHKAAGGHTPPEGHKAMLHPTLTWMSAIPSHFLRPLGAPPPAPDMSHGRVPIMC